MRLATADTARGHRLLMGLEDGLAVDVADAMGATGLELPGGICDVGGLLAAGAGVMDRLSELGERTDLRELAIDEAGVRFAAPILRPPKIVCVGLNYRRHVEESGRSLPDRPMLFDKWPSAVVGCGEPIVKALTDELDYEGELAVVIGRTAKGVEEDTALEHVAGYTILNDVSARDLQRSDPGRQVQWSKSQDTFAPLGRWFVTREEVPDWRSIELRTEVNGELRQHDRCGDMVFGVEALVAWISTGVTLHPGDVIGTGTPSGVGYGWDPPRYLQAGDVVEIKLSGIGSLRSPVVES